MRHRLASCFRELLVASLVGGALGLVFAAGIAWERVQTELDHSQAKGQCYDTATKTRHLSKTEDGWVCFIEHWEGKRKPRITMSRLTE
jgi:hypothetical protein